MIKAFCQPCNETLWVVADYLDGDCRCHRCDSLLEILTDRPLDEADDTQPFDPSSSPPRLSDSTLSGDSTNGVSRGDLAATFVTDPNATRGGPKPDEDPAEDPPPEAGITEDETPGQPPEEVSDRPSEEVSDRPSEETPGRPSDEPSERPTGGSERPSVGPSDQSGRPSGEPSDRPERPSEETSDRPSDGVSGEGVELEGLVETIRAEETTGTGSRVFDRWNFSRQVERSEPELEVGEGTASWDDVAGDLETREAEVEALRRQLSEQTQRFHDQREELLTESRLREHSWREILDESRSEEDRLREQVKVLEQQLAARSLGGGGEGEDAGTLREQNERLSKAIESHHKERDRLYRRLDRVTEERTRLEEELSAARAQARRTKTRLEAELSAARAEVAALTELGRPARPPVGEAQRRLSEAAARVGGSGRGARETGKREPRGRETGKRGVSGGQGRATRARAGRPTRPLGRSGPASGRHARPAVRPPGGRPGPSTGARRRPSINEVDQTQRLSRRLADLDQQIEDLNWFRKEQRPTPESPMGSELGTQLERLQQERREVAERLRRLHNGTQRWRRPS